MATLTEAWEQLKTDLVAADGFNITTQGGVNPPCVVLGHGGWRQRGVSFYPEILIDVIIDMTIKEDYALSMIQDVHHVLETLLGRAYLFDVQPGTATVQTVNKQDYVVTRITAGLIYDEI